MRSIVPIPRDSTVPTILACVVLLTTSDTSAGDGTGADQEQSPGRILLSQTFDSFRTETLTVRDRKSFLKQFSAPPYTIAGFGARAERVRSADEKGRARAGQKSGSQDFVRLSIVEGKNAFSRKALRVLYPDGGNTSSHSGVQYPAYIPTSPAWDRDGERFLPGTRHRELYVSYRVKFEPGFTWQLGGKLPGLIADRGYRDPTRDDRVNARLMWRENGKLEFYIHSPWLKDKTAGKAYDDRIPWDNGDEIDGHAQLTIGRWHHIEFRIKLNDVVNGKPVANGELEGWLDGRQAAFYDDVTLCGSEEFCISTFFFSTFFGGSSGDGQYVWWPTKDVYANFDEIKVSTNRVGTGTR